MHVGIERSGGVSQPQLRDTGLLRGGHKMNWVILVTLALGNPFIVFNKSFEHENACLDYVNDPNNYDTLAIEIIAVAGFNDPVIDIACLPEFETKRRKNG